MFVDDPAFKKPDGGDETKIWRYMSFEKLVPLLDKEVLRSALDDKPYTK